MADRAAVKPSILYISENPESDFQRFKAALRRVVGVPREYVDATMKDEKMERKVEKGKAKNG